MLKYASLLLALVVTASIVVAGDKKMDKGGIAGPMPGDQAPAFTLTDQNGKTVNLSDYSGKIVVLEWFNNTCPFVIKHYKNGDMNNTASQYMGKGVVWLAVNSTDGATGDKMKQVAGDWKMDRPILIDTNTSVARSYGAKNTPTMYIIDKEGKIAYRGAIDDHSDPNPESIAKSKNYVAKALDEMLAGKTVSEPMTKAYGCNVKYRD